MNNEVFNSQVLQLICMLFCIAVIICFFIWRYSKGSDIQNEKAKVQKIHTFYISGILVFIIVELVTGLCMGNNKHSDILSYVNFAATLSSLIMSVVAIIFTIVSGSRGDEQYKKIDNASDKVSESLMKFTEQTSNIDASLASFKDTTDALSNQMERILEIVKGVDKTSKAVLDQVTSSQMSEGRVSNPLGQKGTLNKLEDFVNFGSYSGKLALYACVLSKERNKSFSMREISENADDESYKYGYLIASIAAGVIGVTSPQKDRVFEVNSYYPGLKELLEKSIKEFIDSNNNPALQNSYDVILRFFK